MLLALAGLLGLSVVRGKEWFSARPRLRLAVVGGLVVGLAAVVYWFWGKIDLVPRDFISAKGLVVWVVLVLVPSALAVGQLYVLLWTHEERG